MQQFLCKREEYEEFEKQRDQLRQISAENNIIDYKDSNQYYKVPEDIDQPEPAKMSQEYIDSYKKFGIYVDAYLGEILNQICFKMNKISQHANIQYPKEMKLLFDAFSTQYEKTIVDKIMIINEMGRKLYVTSSPVFSKADRLKPKKSIIKNDNLKIPGVHKEKMKRAVTKADRNFKILASNSSGAPIDKSENITKQKNEINRGVLGYVINKVNKNKKTKGK